MASTRSQYTKRKNIILLSKLSHQSHLTHGCYSWAEHHHKPLMTLDEHLRPRVFVAQNDVGSWPASLLSSGIKVAPSLGEGQVKTSPQNILLYLGSSNCFTLWSF